MVDERKFGGTFEIQEVTRKADRNGGAYSQLDVTGQEGDVRMLAWDGRYSGPPVLRPGMVVNATWTYLPNSSNRRCETLVIVEDARATALYKEAARRLMIMAQQQHDAALHEFLRWLLVEDAHAERFKTEPASRHHHHSYPHGLFVHSVDVALRLFGQFHIDRTDKSLAVMLGLSHDLGKLWLPSDGLIRSGMKHEEFTFAVLAPIVTRMRPRWPELVHDLTHVLSLCQDRKRRLGVPGRIDVLREYLKNADRISCADSWGSGSFGEPDVANDSVSAAA